MRDRNVTSRAVSLFTSVALMLAACPLRAEPQASVGLTIGAAGRGLDREIWSTTAFHLGLHGDVLFGRSSRSDFGVGPYAELLTNGFDEVQFGGGVSGLIPAFDVFPVVVSLGGYARKGQGDFPLEPGLAGEIFFGSRSYNFHANYVMAAGLLGQLRYGLGASQEMSILVGAQIDLVMLSLPFVFLVNAARGGSPETAPVR